MGYSSKNPKFSSVILTDLGTAAGTNAPSGAHRLVDRNGIPFSRSSAGAEIQIGGLMLAKSASYTVTDTDSANVIAMTTAGTNRTVTLPTAADNTHRIITVKKVDSGTGTVTVDGEGSEAIDGGLTALLAVQYEYITMQCDGTGWNIIARNGSTAWQSFTPSISASGGGSAAFATSKTLTGFWRRVGRNMEVRFSYRNTDPTGANAGTSGYYMIAMPGGFTPDTAVLTDIGVSGSMVLGSALVDDLAAGKSYVGSVVMFASTGFTISATSESTSINWGQSAGSCPLTSASGIRARFEANIPITEFI